MRHFEGRRHAGFDLDGGFGFVDPYLIVCPWSGIREFCRFADVLGVLGRSLRTATRIEG